MKAGERKARPGAVRRQCRALRHHREPGLHRSRISRRRSTATPRRSSTAIVAELRADRDLKVEAQRLKHLFAAKAETLLHGDLHTGSIMVTDDDTRVIDPEFAFYGPMAFDVGMLLANFWMSYLLAARPRAGWRPRRDAPLAARRRRSKSGRSSAHEFSQSVAHRAHRHSLCSAACSRIAAMRWGRSRRSTTCCTRSGRTCWALPASRCTAASSASRTMPISRPSPMRICAPPASAKALRFGRHLAVNRRQIHSASTRSTRWPQLIEKEHAA